MNHLVDDGHIQIVMVNCKWRPATRDIPEESVLGLVFHIFICDRIDAIKRNPDWLQRWAYAKLMIFRKV